MLQLQDFEAICPDKLTSALGLQIYTDLVKDEQMQDIQPKYDADTELFYLSTLNGKKLQVYVPVLYSKDISLRQINKLQLKLSDSEIFLAIVDNTANILYYQVIQGFYEKE